MSVARINSGLISDLARRGQPCMQVMRRELVHQKADGAAMHAVDRLAGPHVPMQRFQHQPVAADRHDDIGRHPGRDCRKARPTPPAPPAPPREALATKAIRSYRLGLAIGLSGSWGAGLRRARLYTLAALVEMAGRHFRAVAPTARAAGAPISPAGFGSGPNPHPADFAANSRARWQNSCDGRSTSAERLETCCGELEFAGAPVRKSVGVIGDQRLPGSRRARSRAPAIRRFSAPGCVP